MSIEKPFEQTLSSCSSLNKHVFEIEEIIRTHKRIDAKKLIKAKIKYIENCLYWIKNESL